jgi:hypothetical protein
MGNHPDMYAKFDQNVALPKMAAKILNNRSEKDKEHYFIREGLNYIKEKPGRAAANFYHKFTELWFAGLGKHSGMVAPGTFSIGSIAVPKLTIVSVPFFFMSVVGWFLLPTSGRRKGRPILILFIVWTATYVALYSERRYIVPVQFYELILVSYAIWRGAELLRAKHDCKLPRQTE